jgi:hypothetical protein
MSNYFYEWEDVNDPYAVGHPVLEVYTRFRFKTKKAAFFDFRKYAAEGAFSWKPKMRLWKISYEEIT